MQELEIQKVLRKNAKKGFEYLDSLNIKIDEDIEHGLFLFKYGIDSPMELEICKECRGIILEKKSWNIVSYPFRKFFNHNESNVTEKMDWNNFVAVEKIDGSIITVFPYDDGWLMSTSGKINGSGPVNNHMTFNELFWDVFIDKVGTTKKLNKNFCYIFELVSKHNRIVTHYSKPDLYLIGMRNTETWEELPHTLIKYWSNMLNSNIPKQYSFVDKDNIFKTLELMDQLEEGFVIVNNSEFEDDNISYPRIKIKNPKWVVLHKLKDAITSSDSHMLDLVLQNDETFLMHFPELKEEYRIVQDKWDVFKDNCNNIKNELDNYIIDYPEHTQKDIAIFLKLCAGIHFGCLMNIYNNKSNSIDDYYINISGGTKKLMKLINENIL